MERRNHFNSNTRSAFILKLVGESNLENDGVDVETNMLLGAPKVVTVPVPSRIESHSPKCLTNLLPVHVRHRLEEEADGGGGDNIYKENCMTNRKQKEAPEFEIHVDPFAISTSEKNVGDTAVVQENVLQFESNETPALVGPKEAAAFENSVNTDSPKGRPKKGRKRKHPSQNRQIRKIRCITNEKYFTQRGKLKEPKEFRQYMCRCDCFARIGKETVKQEFDKFYNVSSHDAQRALICAMVNVVAVKIKRVKASDKRSNTREYKINGIKVCKPFFLQTFRISSGKVDLALKCMKMPGGVKDCRGIGGGKNKLSDERLQEVIEHIDKFPKYKSHYRREKSDAQYLRPDTTLPIMYNLYKQESKAPVSFSKYKNIFLTHFNLKRKPLKKDTCNTCDKLEVLLDTGSQDERDRYKEQKEVHLSLAKKARNLLSSDRKTAIEDENLEVLCFDLEKTLPLPRIPTNTVFYKRQLWLYNSGIHTAKHNKGHCYVWLEGEAGRGAQEVGSCLYKHITETINFCKHLILWSDSCGGQNRNIKIVLILKAVMDVHPTIEKITLRYLLPGHSFLPNDTDFGDIECALKLQQRMYTPEDYIRVMKACRKKNPLVVDKMKNQEFFGTASLENSIVNRKKDVLKNKINWLKIREIQLLKEKPYSMFIKNDFEGEKHEVDFQKKRGRPPQSQKKFGDLLINLWPNGKPISEKKIIDLQCLMGLIPNDAKPFYENLIGDPIIEDDIDGFDGELDFDVEEDVLE